MNKSILACALITFAFVCTSVYGESLDKIEKFSEGICKEIRPEGKITRTEIEAKLSGSMDGVAKLLGLSAGASGGIKSENTNFTGLPYNKISEEMTGARECRLQLAVMLINERRRVNPNIQGEEQSNKAVINGDGNKINQANRGREIKHGNQRNELKLDGGGNHVTHINQ